jgi:hypothetical protein
MGMLGTLLFEENLPTMYTFFPLFRVKQTY